MPPSSSSISSSKRRHARLRAVGATLLWTVLFIAAIDGGLGLAFRYPGNPNILPTALARYFDYGRSVDSKLARMVGVSDEDAAPIVLAGWLGRECIQPIAPAPPGQIGVSIYGMSFSQHIGEALPEIDPVLAPITRNGPAASPSHSYACFRMLHDAGRDPNPVQILGVLASSLPRMLSLSGITTSFEAPMPFTFPRYRLGPGGELVAEQPLITSPEELRDPDRVKAFYAQLARSDAFYDPWQVDAGLAEDTALLRLLRRSYAQREFAIRRRRLIGDTAGFVDNPQLGPVLSALLVDFDARARRRPDADRPADPGSRRHRCPLSLARSDAPPPRRSSREHARCRTYDRFRQLHRRRPFHSGRQPTDHRAGGVTHPSRDRRARGSPPDALTSPMWRPRSNCLSNWKRSSQDSIHPTSAEKAGMGAALPQAGRAAPQAAHSPRVAHRTQRAASC
jgi:hypothetical protein